MSLKTLFELGKIVFNFKIRWGYHREGPLMRDVCRKMTKAFTFVRTECLRCELYRRWRRALRSRFLAQC